MKPIDCKRKLKNHLYFKALEATSMGVVITDSDGDIQYVNPSFIKSSGMGRDKLIGRNILTLSANTDHESRLEEVWFSIKDGKKWNEKIVIKNKNNSVVFNEAAIRPIAEKGEGSYFLFEFFEVQESSERETKLKKLLTERETLIKEIHHRIKNNLAVISGLLTLQKFTYDDDRLFVLLSDSEMRIKSMALIHEKLYRSETLSSIEFSTYLEDLIQSIRQTLTKRTNISISVNCESIELNINQAVPSALIVNEIISNSYKYAYPDNRKGVIRVEVFKHENKLHFEVEDDGVGLPDNFEEKRKSSLGFTIIDTLVSQLEADLQIESNHGTRILFSYDYE